jgi:hypothetical protein
MTRRIDVELTSHSDGSWTWRAAGARQPKGTVEEALVPAGEGVGSVLRAEVETGLDGIEIVALSAPKPVRSAEKAEGRIEVRGTPKRAPDVSVVLAPGSASRSRRDDGERKNRRGGGRRADSEGAGRSREVRDTREDRGDRPRGSGGPRRPAGRSQGNGGGRAVRGERPVMPTSTVHRNAMLAALRPEQVPVAEQLLRGGLQAVRRAIDTQNAAAQASGKPPASEEALLAMAEELLPAVRLADWKDRAAVAQAAGKDYRLRELRSVVAASRTVILDEEGRGMAKALQESLEQRSTALREEWLARINNALNEGRIQQALEASVRPPEPGTRCPAELAVRLADEAGAAMTAELPPDEWMRLLDSVVASPVRRTVKPGRHPRRRSGAAGGASCRRFGAGTGQDGRAAHPASATAQDHHPTPLQSNRRLSVRRRAVNPASSRRCFVDRSPGRAMASTTTHSRDRHQSTAACSNALPTPTPRPPAST